MLKSLFSTRSALALLAVVVALGLGSCRIFEPYPPTRAVDHRAVVPPDFLHSWDRDYNNWMDTPVRILYHQVPLTEVFNQHPFTRLSYQWVRLPPKIPKISMDAKGITRRQYLWSLAHDNNLSMHLRSTASGEPETVGILWRGTESDVNEVYRGGYSPNN